MTSTGRSIGAKRETLSNTAKNAGDSPSKLCCILYFLKVVKLTNCW
ncbi:Uncharacterised protein [Vibrio cholerae]|nr:Uncharacterised protein [Vibrio cholerae]